MNMLIKTQTKFAKYMAVHHVNSEQGETARGNAHRDLPKPSELAMHIEMGVLAAVFGSLAMGAWICFLKTPDWIASIHRLQDMA